MMARSLITEAIMAVKRKADDSPSTSRKRVLQLREQETDDASDGDDDSVNSMLPQDDKVNDMQDTEDDDGGKEKDTMHQTKLPCPCGCTIYSHPSAHSFRTHERDSMRLFVFGPELINYRGKCYSADDIAPLWKKDCRKWLWKSHIEVLE